LNACVRLPESGAPLKKRVTMSIQQNTASSAVSSTTSKLLQALSAVALGLFIVGFVGFSHVEAMHNAAHDTRHANAFPCH
jgi:cobalt transporter subunit CbtB